MKFRCEDCDWSGFDPLDLTENSHGYRCPECGSAVRKHRLKHYLREKAEEILSNGRSRASSQYLANIIRRKKLEESVVSSHDLRQITSFRVGCSLRGSPKFRKIGASHNGGAMWELAG